VVTRQRSNTLHELPVNNESSKKHHCDDCPIKQSLLQENGIYSPEAKRRTGFYEIAWSIVSTRRRRSSKCAASSHKHNSSKCNAHLSSPLVAISNYRNLLQMSQATEMSRQLTPTGEARPRGSSSSVSPDCCNEKEEEQQPASVENLVRRSAECFGKIFTDEPLMTLPALKNDSSLALLEESRDYTQ